MSVSRCRKMMIKPLLHHYPLDAKSQICIGIAKIKKPKTWPLSKFILDQGYVLGNANFDARRKICDFILSKVLDRRGLRLGASNEDQTSKKYLRSVT